MALRRRRRDDTVRAATRRHQRAAATTNTIRRRRDALDAAFRDVVVRRRLAAELKVWRDGFYAASSSTSSPEPLPHEDAIAATHHQYTAQVRRGAPRRASSGRTRATGASASGRCSSSAARRRRASR